MASLYSSLPVRRKAEAAARLHHTKIVPVYATGEQDRTHFYAMGLIGGPLLDHVVKQLRQSRAETPVADAGRSASLEASGPYVESGPRASSATVLGSSAPGSASGYVDRVARIVSAAGRRLPGRSWRAAGTLSWSSRATRSGC
jgi:hypothetical protein